MYVAYTLWLRGGEIERLLPKLHSASSTQRWPLNYLDIGQIGCLASESDEGTETLWKGASCKSQSHKLHTHTHSYIHLHTHTYIYIYRKMRIYIYISYIFICLCMYIIHIYTSNYCYENLAASSWGKSSQTKLLFHVCSFIYMFFHNLLLFHCQNWFSFRFSCGFLACSCLSFWLRSKANIANE